MTQVEQMAAQVLHGFFRSLHARLQVRDLFPHHERVLADVRNSALQVQDRHPIPDVHYGRCVPQLVENFSELAHMLGEGMGFGWAEAAFSSVADPRLEAALTRGARMGFRRIIVFPYFLFTGVLVKRVYAQPDAVARLFPDIDFVNAPYLRDHPEVLDAFHDRVREVRDGQSEDDAGAVPAGNLH